ncbi:poly-gamma-glutamate biosynthesis protein [Amycolatopsis antarctica]|uniref:Poly-gamma-glutamate biosynthesis protein n=1 Tax=Amycolatopsis antarctica TaxID=1854586 RepID=A0A263CXK3_9PSEU|nr:CapA family protein [Amycolatopsis antarctica]OZM70873.1 poly-gamma-glutamate biosynthesis protein [Amycolatopsis antarctica]
MNRRCGAVVLAGVLMVAGCGAGTERVPSTTTPPPPSQPVAPPSPAGFSVVATGDVLVHPPLTEQAESDGGGRLDFRPQFEGVRSVVSEADLGLCHLEVPLAEPGGPYSGYPSFNAPPEVAGALKDTGYDACSTASNHTLDQGEEGVKRTLDGLDAGGLRHTGSARSPEEAATPLLLDAAGTKVGHISFTFGFNGIELPEGKPWMANQLDAEAVLAGAREARDAGAEVVIASLHWGAEYRAEPTEEQTELANRLLADDAVDLIIGHHAHVVQPFEKIGEKWVAYGLGNHIAKHSEPRGTTEEGVAARFHFAKEGDGWRVDRAEYVPTLVELGPPIRLVDATSAASARQQEALAGTDEVVLSRDAAAAGLTRPGSR